MPPPPPVPIAAPRYVLGDPAPLGGLWAYPREDFALVETGLAATIADRRPGRRTANGEIHDPATLQAAHRTLQLPAIVLVTNLETGLALTVRVNDRGPDQPGRVLALSRRAAALLGVPEGGAAQIRLVVLPAPSRALAAALPADAPRGPAVEAAPVEGVVREALAPPEGTRARPGREGAAVPGVATLELGSAAALPPDPLPEALARVPVQPGRLVLELGRFFRRDLAAAQAARFAGLGARVEAVGAQHRVRLGPFDSVATADAAVGSVLTAGVSELALRIE